MLQAYNKQTTQVIFIYIFVKAALLGINR